MYLQNKFCGPTLKIFWENGLKSPRNPNFGLFRNKKSIKAKKKKIKILIPQLFSSMWRTSVPNFKVIDCTPWKALAHWKKLDNPTDNHTDNKSTYSISSASEARICSYYDKQVLLQFVPKGSVSNKPALHGSEDSLAPNRHQTIVWTNDCLTYWRKYAPLCLDEYIHHYGDVIMGTIESQITCLTIVCSSVNSDADQRKHQSSAALAGDRWIPRTNGQ